MKAKRYITALGAFFALAIGLSACGSSVPGNAVANMDGNPVTLQAFNHWMFVAAKSQAAQDPGQPVIVPEDPPNFNNCVTDVRRQISSLAKTSTKTLRGDCQSLFTSLSSQVMDFLITSYWYQAEAAHDHVNVSDAQVQKAFQTAKKQQFTTNSQYTQFLSETGQTEQDIIYRFRINQIFEKLVAKQNKKVTAAQIAAYYNSHKSSFGTPESRDVRIVLTKTASAAAAAKSALQHGQSWSAVVKKYSIDTATKATGGLLAGIVKGEEDAALNNVAFSAPVNQLEGPVKGQFGYYVVEVVKIHPATQQSLAAVQATIRQTLTSTQQQTAQNAAEAKARKDWQSKTSCRSLYSMSDCKGYKKPKTSTSATATTG